MAGGLTTIGGAAPWVDGEPVFAALDLGTNSCRLLMAAQAPGGFRVVDSFSRVVGLGAGLDGEGRLSDEVMARALLALRVCAGRLGRWRVRAVRAVATEACRRATNGRAFLMRVQSETGLRFEIITAREEAELALESCGPLLSPTGRRALLFDIGGGSTELAWVRLDGASAGGVGRVPELIGYTSIPVGVVSLAERHGAARFTAAGYDAMVDELRGAVAAFEGVHRIRAEMRRGGVQLLGTSGTVTTLAGVALRLARYRRTAVDGTVLTLEAADAALATLRALGQEGLHGHPCVGPERVPFVLPGCALFQAIRDMWPLPEILVADRGLREGLLLRLIRDAAAVHPVQLRGAMPAAAVGG